MQITEKFQAGSLGALGQRRSADKALPLPATVKIRQPCLRCTGLRPVKPSVTSWREGNSHERAQRGICQGLSQVLLGCACDLAYAKCMWLLHFLRCTFHTCAEMVFLICEMHLDNSCCMLGLVREVGAQVSTMLLQSQQLTFSF